jgi:hypothetical protein
MKRAARVPSQLSESLHKQLNAYALAASAAGVGVLAFAQPAEARIVYKPAHKHVFANSGVWAFDINGDGTPDFNFDTFASDDNGGGMGIDLYGSHKRLRPEVKSGGTRVDSWIGQVLPPRGVARRHFCRSGNSQAT